METTNMLYEIKWRPNPYAKEQTRRTVATSYVHAVAKVCGLGKTVYGNGAVRLIYRPMENSLEQPRCIGTVTVVR